jgi:hypothetical protein
MAAERGCHLLPSYMLGQVCVVLPLPVDGEVDGDVDGEAAGAEVAVVAA